MDIDKNRGLADVNTGSTDEDTGKDTGSAAGNTRSADVDTGKDKGTAGVDKGMTQDQHELAKTWDQEA